MKLTTAAAIVALIAVVLFGVQNPATSSTYAADPLALPDPSGGSGLVGSTDDAPTNIGVWLGLSGTDLLKHTPGSGISWAKVSLYWRQIEPRQDEYNFQRMDQLLARRSSTSVIVTIMGIPDWAGESENGDVVRVAPSNYPAFRNLMQKLAQRNVEKGYNVKIWEVFNEPENKDADYAEYISSAYGYHPEMYADLLKYGREGLKAGDPNAKLAFGGMAMEDFHHFVPDFAQKVFAYIHSKGSDGSNYFDYMNIHAYAYYYQRWSAPEYGSQPGMLGKINYVKKLMRDAGLADRPVLITETGIEVGNPKPDVYQQAAYAIRAYVEGKVAGSPAIIWFTLSDNEGAGRGAVGIMDGNYQPRPAYWATRHLASWLDGASYVGPSAGLQVVSGKAYGFGFQRGSSVYHVVWGAWDGYTAQDGPTGGDATVRFPGNYARVTDMFGSSYVVDGAGGVVTLPLTYKPVYVELFATPPPPSTPINWATASLQVTCGGSGVLTVNDGLVEVEIPAGSTPSSGCPHTFYFGPATTAAQSVAGGAQAVVPAFRLEVMDAQGNPVTVLPSAISLRVGYREDALGYVVEPSIQLQRRGPGESEWSTRGISGQTTYVLGNLVDADVTQLGWFDLFGQVGQPMFLPLSSRP